MIDPTDGCPVCGTTSRDHADDCTSRAAQIRRAATAFNTELNTNADKIGQILSARQIPDPEPKP